MFDSAVEGCRELANAQVLAAQFEQLTQTIDQMHPTQQTLNQDLLQMATQQCALQAELTNVNNKLEALQGPFLQQQPLGIQQQQGQSLTSMPAAQ